MSKQYSIADNDISNDMKMPLEKRKASLFYKTANSNRSKDTDYLKMIWQRDLGHDKGSR